MRRGLNIDSDQKQTSKNQGKEPGDINLNLASQILYGPAESTMTVIGAVTDLLAGWFPGGRLLTGPGAGQKFEYLLFDGGS